MSSCKTNVTTMLILSPFPSTKQFEDTKRVIRNRKFKDRQHNGQKKKTKLYTENRGWTQVLKKGKPFLLHIWHLSYNILLVLQPSKDDNHFFRLYVISTLNHIKSPSPTVLGKCQACAQNVPHGVCMRSQLNMSSFELMVVFITPVYISSVTILYTWCWLRFWMLNPER